MDHTRLEQTINSMTAYGINVPDDVRDRIRQALDNVRTGSTHQDHNAATDTGAAYL